MPTQNGHSLVAKRATSPKAPRDQAKMGRAGSPLAQTSTTPGSPTSATRPLSHKRKAEEGGPPSEGAAPKKRKRATVVAVEGELEDSMVIDWLRTTTNASTRDCINNFTPYIRDEGKKEKFIGLIKSIAQLKGGVLVLKPEYR